MKNTIYIAGKVTGLDYKEVVIKFDTAKKELLAQGWKTVINPLEVIANPNEEWHSAMKICIVALHKCEAIFMLPCSVDSPGAQIELQYAIEHNLDIYY